MELQEFIRQVTQIPGTPGREMAVAQWIRDAFAPLVDEATVDGMNNTIARVGRSGPRIMMLAHLDEIGMVVRAIEEDGCLRIVRTGGVDPRILPAHEVTIHARDGALFGVVGSKPPHVQSPSDRNKAIQFDDLYVDTGYSPEVVRAKVRVGDMVTLRAPAMQLAGEVMASKTMDDRACVAVMLECARIMQHMQIPAEVFFVSTSQEEIGSYGALTSAHALDPDIALVLDVTHGEGPGTKKLDAFPLEKVVIGQGPTLHPLLVERLKHTAKEQRIDSEIEIFGTVTWTDADSTQTARAGIPTALVSVPCRYMHTSVETVHLDTIREAGRLLAQCISDIAREWEALVWF